MMCSFFHPSNGIIGNIAMEHALYPRRHVQAGLAKRGAWQPGGLLGNLFGQGRYLRLWRRRHPGIHGGSNLSRLSSGDFSGRSGAMGDLPAPLNKGTGARQYQNRQKRKHDQSGHHMTLHRLKV